MGGNDHPAVGRVLGRLSLWCSTHAKLTTVLIAVMTLGVGYGMIDLETDSDLLKILPKDNPTTIAAQNASTQFRGFYDFVYVYYAIDEAKCEQHQVLLPFKLGGPENTGDRGCADVRDETYVRAMDEFWSFAQERIPFAEYAIDLAGIVKLINYTNSGVANDDPQSAITPLSNGEVPNPAQPVPPRAAAYSMPGTDAAGSAQYEGAWQGANAADDSINDAISPEFTGGRTLIFFDTSQGLTRVELGNAVYDMVDAYRAEVAACDDGDTSTRCSLRWNVFDVDEEMPVRGVSALDAHASEVTQNDISKLAPFIIWAIILVLYLAFRDARVLLVSTANLLVAFVWTAGMMGWLQIPFSALNMTIVPLILGVGIDYGIHMISEFLEHKSEGMSNGAAFQEAGSRAGIAMGIATLTTGAGLLLMAFSPSILMAQLGIVSAIALTVTFLFTLTFIPALLTLTARRRLDKTHQGSEIVLNIARTVAKYRAVSIIVVLLTTGVMTASMVRLEPEPFGNPELNFPEGDRVRDDSRAISESFFGGRTDTQSNFLVVEGDLRQPQAHEFLDGLVDGLRAHPELNGFSVTSLTRLVRAWKAVEGGTPDALVNQFVLANSGDDAVADFEYPSTQAEIEETFDAIFASPFANFMTVLLQPGSYDLGTVTYDTHQELTYAEVERIWTATWETIYRVQNEVYGLDQRDASYSGIQAHPFGNNAFSFLFIDEQLPWVNYVAYLAFGLVIVMIGLLTRNVRATLCTAAVMGTTSIWWLGTLPMIGVGLSVGLMLPLVFIMAIGSDDAIHLIWNMERTNNPNKVWRFVGKAVALTTITTLVAFMVFSFQTDLLVRRTLFATALAVVAMWVSTMLIVPLFYPPREEPIVQRRQRPVGHLKRHAEPEILVAAR
jgi:predicted RND superfamily exporter protein